MMEKVRILRTKPEDAKQLADVYYYTWLATYPSRKHHIRASDIAYRYMNRHKKEELERRKKMILNPKKGHHMFVAKIGNNIVGLCNVIIDPGKNQLKSMYVLPQYQRRGIGKMLWRKVIPLFNKKNRTILYVAEYNETAIKFYEKLGFKRKGKTIIDKKSRMRNGAIIPTIRMVMLPGGMK